MSDRDTGPPPFEELLALALERRALDGEAGFADLAEQYPEHAEELRTRIAELANLGFAQLTESNYTPEWFGKFRVKERIAAGGMGVVLLVTEEQLGRDVALKMLPAHLVSSEIARQRFSQEIRAIARLSHRNIIPIYDVGEHQGVPYFTMEYVRGYTLAEIIRELQVRVDSPARATSTLLRECFHAPPGDSQETRTSYVAEVCDLILQICDALEHAHSRGILHRDVKPSNILISPSGQVRLFDFGLAHDADIGAHALTNPGDFVGTPHYVSPEQATGSLADVDARTDVFSLGALFYELLTFHTPFTGTTQAALLRAIQHREPTPPRKFNPEIPRDLENICLTALEKSRGRRYSSAAELKADVLRFLAYRPVQARPVSISTRVYRWGRRNPMRATLAGLAIALPIGLVVANRQIQAEADRAESVVSAFEEALLEIDPAELGANARAIDFLDRAERITTRHLADQPGRLGHLLLGIGRVRVGWGRMKSAEVTLQQAQRRLLAAEGEDSLSLADCYNQLGTVALYGGDTEKAAGLYRQTLKIRQAHYPPAHEEVVQVEYNLATMESRSPRKQRSVDHFHRVLRLTEQNPVVENRIIATISHCRIGLLEFERGDLDAAQKGWQAAQDLLDRDPAVHSEQDWLIPLLEGNIAMQRQQIKRAVAAFQRSQRVAESAFHAGHPNVAYVNQWVVEALLTVGQAEAAHAWVAGLLTRVGSLEQSTADRALSLIVRARAEFHLKRFDAVLKTLAMVVPRDLVAPSERVRHSYLRGRALARLGRFDAARPLLQSVVDTKTRVSSAWLEAAKTALEAADKAMGK